MAASLIYHAFGVYVTVGKNFYKMQSQALKGLRWIVLKNPENPDEEKNQHEQLEKALQMNKPLATAFYLKRS